MEREPKLVDFARRHLPKAVEVVQSVLQLQVYLLSLWEKGFATAAEPNGYGDATAVVFQVSRTKSTPPARSN